MNTHITYTFDTVTSIAKVTVNPLRIDMDIFVPIDIIQSNKIEEYVNGFLMTREDVQRMVLSENSKSKTVMYVSPNTVISSPNVKSILNRCHELHPVRFKWTSDINDGNINDCFYDYRFNDEFITVFDKHKLNKHKFIISLQNKSVLNDILRTSNFNSPGTNFSSSITPPYIISLKTPKNLDELTNYFKGVTGLIGVDNLATSYIVKPVYGFHPNTRVYDRKVYTDLDTLLADIKQQHETLDNFFLMQKNEPNFVWSEQTKNDTPIFMQNILTFEAEFTCYCFYAETKLKVEIMSPSTISIDTQTNIIDLIEPIMLLYRLNFSFVTIKGIISNEKIYIVDLSQSMYPLLTGEGEIKDIHKLADILFSVSAE